MGKLQDILDKATEIFSMTVEEDNQQMKFTFVIVKRKSGGWVDMKLIKTVITDGDKKTCEYYNPKEHSLYTIWDDNPSYFDGVWTARFVKKFDSLKIIIVLKDFLNLPFAARAMSPKWIWKPCCHLT